jgi:outer membrane protein assembly factor BamB
MTARQAGVERWAFAPGGPDPIVGEPLVIGDSVFFTRGDTLYELDRSDGRLLWSRVFVRRKGLARIFPRSRRGFESQYGVPLLSRRGRLIVISCHTPDGEFIDVALDVHDHREHDPGANFDPFTVWASDGSRLDLEGVATGHTPVVRVSDPRGQFLWDSRWAIGDGLESSEWISVIGRPAIAGDRVLFGVRDTTLQRGSPVGYRLFALRLSDGDVLWRQQNRSSDLEVLGAGVDDSVFWIVVRQRDGSPVLRFLRAADGAVVSEARFPGLTGGIALAEGVLYGGFGKTFLAVELTL